MANNKIQGITVEIGGDSTPLSKAIDSANQKSRLLQQELRGVNTLMKGDPNSAVLLSQKQEILNKSVEETRAKLQMLKSKQEEVTQAFQKNEITEEQYRNFQREIEKTEQDLVNLRTKQLECASVKFDNAINSTKRFGETLTGIGNKLKTLSVAVIAIGTASFKTWSNIDEGLDTIIAKTGATGKEFEKLKQIATDVFKNTKFDMPSIGKSLGEIKTRLSDLTDDELKTATVKFLKFAELNEIDVSTAVQKVSRYMGDASIEATEYSTVLDVLTKAAQDSGVSIDVLTEYLTKYGAPLRALGFETQEAIALFAQWEKAGVNTEIAFSGMKKAISNWADSGKDSREEFKKTLDEIKKCPNIAKATTKAIETFGTKAGPDLADAIQGGRFEYTTFLNAIKKSKGTLEDTFEATEDPIDKLKSSINNLKSVGADLFEQISESATPIIDDFGDKIKDLSEWWNGLNDSQKESVVKIAGIVAVGAPALILLGKATTGIATLTSNLKTAIISIMAKTTATEADTVATTTATAATGALSVAMKALPLLAIAGLVVTVTSELVNLCSATEDTESKNKKLAEQIKSTSEEFENYKKSVEETMNQDLSQIEVTQNLADELETLVDKNGKVKKGYEKRVDFINKELNEALGLELERNGDVEDGYKKIGNAIDKLIQKKRAQIVLDTQEKTYSEAIKKQKEVSDGLNEAADEYNKSLAKKSKLEKEYNALVENQKTLDKALQDVQKDGITINSDACKLLKEYGMSQEEVNKIVEEGKGAVDENSEAYIILSDALNVSKEKIQEWNSENNAEFQKSKKEVEDCKKTYNSAKNSYIKNQKAIQEYQKNYELFASGHYQKVINSVSSSEKIIADISKASQKEIKDAYEQTCERIKHFQAEKKNATTASEKQMWKDLIKKTKTERDEYKNKLDSFSKSAGKSADKNTAEGIKENKNAVGTAFGDVVDSATNIAFSRSTVRQSQRGGNVIATNLASGIKSYDISPATNKILHGVWQTIHSDNTESGMNDSGYFLTAGVASGAVSSSALSLIKNAGEKVYTTYKNSLEGEAGIASPAKKMMPDGAYLVMGVVKGAENEISKQIPNLKNKARELMNVFSNDVPDEYYSTNLGANFHTAVEHTFSNLETQSTAQTVEALSSDVAKIEKQLERLIEKAQKNIVIDGKALVGATVSETDKRLGNRQEFIGRGLPT